MIITIDGPAGAGKSSAAKALARRIGFQFLDTGAMYRAVALAAMRRAIRWDDAAEVARLAGDIEIEVGEDHVLLDGEDVTHEIRSVEVTSSIHHVAENPGVRAELVQLQRNIANAGDFVTEGRDQGTVAFPDAECKIFLTASPQERARRRIMELHARGENLTYNEVLAQQNERDIRDRSRGVGPLVAADDAFRVTSNDKSLDQVVDELEEYARRMCHLTK